MVNLDSHEAFFLNIEETKRLGKGLYTTDEIMTFNARDKFLNAISFEVPECLDSLKEIFKERYPSIQKLRSKAGTNWPSLEKSLSFDEGQTLYLSLTNWAKKWNINENWMIDDAFIALLSWVDRPSLFEQIYWYSNKKIYYQAVVKALEKIKQMLKDPEYPKSPRDYSPFLYSSRKEYLNLQQEYMDKVEEMYLKNGFRKTPIKRGEPQKHFIWLVLFLLKGKNPIEIAELYQNRHPEIEDVSPKSVQKAIKELANLIGLKISI